MGFTGLLLTTLLATVPPTTAFVGISPAAPATEGELSRALGASPAISFQAREVTARFLGAAKGLGVDCDPLFDECLAQLASLCGVAQAVYANVDGARLTLRVVAAEGAEVRAATVTVEGRDAARSVAFAELVAQLLEPITTATIAIEAPTASVILLDDVQRGVAPLPPLAGVVPGVHLLEVRFPGGSSSKRNVVLAPNRRLRVVIVQKPITADVFTWGGAATVALSAVAAAVGTGLVVNHALQLSTLEQLDRGYRASDAGADFNDGSVRDRAVDANNSLDAVGAYGAPAFAGAAAGAVVGGAAWLLGAWWSELFDSAAEETQQ